MDIQPRKRRRRRWSGLVIGLLFIALAVAAIFLIPPAIDTHHVTVDPTPGQVSLPPTATMGHS